VTAFDFAVLGVIILSGVFAYWRGFVREALSIAAWILAAAAAWYAYPYALPIAERFLPQGAVANIATGTVIFVLALMVLHVIANAMAARVKHSHLSPIDRTFGLLFGLARGLILVCLAYIALAWMWPAGDERPRWFAESRTLPYLDFGAEKLESYFSRSRSKLPGRAAASVEREAQRAIGAFTNPLPSAASSASDPPAYTPGEQRDLNRLIQQQNAQ
jgi:membrane protein required for colicin V production